MKPTHKPTKPPAGAGAAAAKRPHAKTVIQPFLLSEATESDWPFGHAASDHLPVAHSLDNVELLQFNIQMPAYTPGVKPGYRLAENWKFGGNDGTGRTDSPEATSARYQHMAAVLTSDIKMKIATGKLLVLALQESNPEFVERLTKALDADDIEVAHTSSVGKVIPTGTQVNADTLIIRKADCALVVSEFSQDAFISDLTAKLSAHFGVSELSEAHQDIVRQFRPTMIRQEDGSLLAAINVHIPLMHILKNPELNHEIALLSAMANQLLHAQADVAHVAILGDLNLATSAEEVSYLGPKAEQLYLPAIPPLDGTPTSTRLVIQNADGSPAPTQIWATPSNGFKMQLRQTDGLIISSKRDGTTVTSRIPQELTAKLGFTNTYEYASFRQTEIPCEMRTELSGDKWTTESAAGASTGGATGEATLFAPPVAAPPSTPPPACVVRADDVVVETP